MSLKDIKNWGPDVEKEITEAWKNADFFKFDSKVKKPIYSIDTPPPYINAPVHIGQAVTYCYMDMFARYKRMKGFQVVFPLGLDRNGLPIELGAEKKFNVSPFEIGREKFLEYCKKLLEDTSSETKDTFEKLGISFTSYKEGGIGGVYTTDSDDYRTLTQSTFIDLYKKGLVYEDSRINNWDPKLRTTIADSEIEYKDLPTKFVHVKWKVKETGEEIIIATTRPELICTCGMIIFNPNDERYKHLDGKTAITPLFEKHVKIKSHLMADIEKGTGIVMMCSAGDLSDIQFFREQNLNPVIAINKDGTMNKHSGFLEGLKVKDARKKIIEMLDEKGLIIKQEDITHRTPISERSKAEVEFIEMPEFYLMQVKFKEDVRKISDKVNFYPESSRKILHDWIDSVSIDWPISRRRFYATEIPLWYAYSEKGAKLVAIPKQGKYYQPWKQKVPEDAEIWKEGRDTGRKVKDFKNLDWKGEERVFDTWMDSSVSELFILKYKDDEDFFRRAFPASLRPQGKEIVRTWLYYTLLRGFLETKKPCFKDVWIHQHILDMKGRKMSKSIGNVIDPHELLKDYGGEAIRFWSVIEGDLSKQDLNCSKEKIQAELKTLTKILNIAKFVKLFNKPKKITKLCAIDKLFIEYIDDMTRRFNKSYEEYDFHNPSLELRKFIWDIFASHYIEIVKARAYNQEGKFRSDESDSAKYALYFLFERFLMLAYPIIPQITSLIAKDFNIDLLKLEFPKIKESRLDFSVIEKIMEFNSSVWKTKKDKGLSLRSEISGIIIPSELKEYEKDLRVTHNIS